MVSLTVLVDHVLPCLATILMVALMPGGKGGRNAPEAEAADASTDTKRRRHSKSAPATGAAEPVVDLETGPINHNKLDRDQVKTMLGYLNYQAVAKKATPASRCAHKKALDTYAALSPEVKPQFIADFFKNKKQITFATSYSEKVTNVRSESSSYNVNLLLRSQILAHNNFDHQRMDEHAIEETLQELLKLNHQEFNYQPKCVDHSNPAFRKYAYYVGKGTEIVSSKLTEDSMNITADLSTSAASALAEADNIEIVIKAEKPQQTKHHACVAILKSASQSLLRLSASAEEVMYKLMEKEGMDSHVQELEPQIQALQDFLKIIRKDVIKNDGLTEKSEDEFRVITDDLEKKNKQLSRIRKA